MNVLIASLMLLIAIQADAAPVSFKQASSSLQPYTTDADMKFDMQRLEDERSGASDNKQRILEDQLYEAEQKHFVVAAKKNGIDRIVRNDEKQHSILKTAGLLTDDRNAKTYLHDADKVLQGKVELKTEKRARFAAEVIEQERMRADIAVRVVKKNQQAKTVEAKYTEQEKEVGNLVELKKKEAKLNRAVTQSQISRLSDIQAKLDLDKRGIDALISKFKFEASQETKLTSELATIVHNDEQVTKVKADLSSKTAQLDWANSQLESVRAQAAQDKLDCAKNKLLALLSNNKKTDRLADVKAIIAEAGEGEGDGADVAATGGFLAK